ncbi:monovalent cation/H+ antiporter complex subunit F [Roseixanthobacter glucoisosaccharinicivorans]|uniref:monovalent cation/H+ antiporter complex subunit F n=1 Tax=Roseixanthobacter glucoisosaccharinicivorans TaxID=3119923 RepID=UPI003727465E
MAETFLGFAAVLLAFAAAALIRLWRSPGAADQMMAVQLLGSVGVAVLLLLFAGTGTPAILDVALLLALLAAFAAAAFHSVRAAPRAEAPPQRSTTP